MVDNQRAHPRYAVAVDVAVTLRDGQTVFCSIKDFSIGGLFLGGHAVVDTLGGAIDTGVVVKLEFDTPEGTYQFDGEIVRFTDAGAGVRFTHRNIAALKYLQDLSAKQGESVGEHGGVMLRQPNPAVAEACGRIIHTFVAWLIEEYLKRLSEDIFDASSKAANNDEQSSLFHAFKELKRIEGGIHEQFMTMMEKQIALYTTTDFENAYRTHDHKSRDAGLSLIDKDEFDNWLSITSLITSIESRYDQELYEVGKRLDSISINPVNRENNPAAPHAMGHIFFDAIDGMFEDSFVNQLVYESYQKLFRIHFPELLAQLNALFRDESILNDLEQEYQLVKGEDVGIEEDEESVTADAPSRSGISSPNVARGDPGVSESQTVPPTVSTQPESSLSATDQIRLKRGAGSYGTLRDLLSYARDVGQRGIAHRGEAPPAVSVSGESFSSQDVMQGLSQIPSESGLQGLREEGVNVAEYLTNHLRKDNPDGQDMVIAAPEYEAIGMMEQLLGTMQFDRLMNTIVKNWLQKLEVPLLKAMVNEPDMLSRDDSPAQQLIDRLDNLGEIVPESPPEESKEIRAKIDKLIGRVTDEVETNADVIPETVIELDKIHKEELQSYNKNLEGAVEAGKKEHKVYKARRFVLTEINKLIGGRKIPEIVLELLDAGWKNLLLSTYMREGHESTVFKTYLGIIDQLHKLLAITKSYNDTETKTALKTYEWIERMLSISAHDKKRAADVSAQLKGLLQKDGVPPRAEIKIKKVPMLDVDTFSGVLDDDKFKPDEIDENEWQRWIIKGKNLIINDAGIFTNDDDDTIRVSLAWIDGAHSHFIFVDQSGKKKLGISIGELALRLYDHSLEMLEGGGMPIIDRVSQVIIEDTHEKVIQYAQTDELTGLLSRRAFVQEIERVLRSAKRDSSTHILCYLDLDRFNVINNTCGHEAGERLLEEVTSIFKAECDKGTIISHLNGDEFGFIFENCHRVAGLEKAKKIQQALRNFYFKCDDNEFSITASIGAVEISKDSESQRELLSAVDSACFAAKEAGRDRIQLSHIDNKILKARQSAMEWVGRIKSLFDKDLVRLRCQKIAPLHPESGLRAHYEVLLVVKDEAGNPVSLEEFISAAELYNRITDIDQWVVGSVLDWLEDNQSKISHIDGLSVNISGNSMSDKLFMDNLYDRLTSGNFDPRFITFEVTETSAIDDIDYAIFFINKLKTTGCRFSLDDFGTGLSSYAYLRKLPVDYLKIDGVFVKNIDTSEDDMAVVHSISEIGHVMGKKIIAEFVANEAVLKKITETDIEFGQGYAIEKPITLDQLLKK